MEATHEYKQLFYPRGYCLEQTHWCGAWEVENGPALPSATYELCDQGDCRPQPQFPYMNDGNLWELNGMRNLKEICELLYISKITENTYIFIRKSLRDDRDYFSHFANKEIDHKQWSLRTNSTRILHSSPTENIWGSCWFAPLREKSGPILNFF